MSGQSGNPFSVSKYDRDALLVTCRLRAPPTTRGAIQPRFLVGSSHYDIENSGLNDVQTRAALPASQYANPYTAKYNNFSSMQSMFNP